MIAPPLYIYSVGTRVCNHHVLQAEADPVEYEGDNCIINSSNVTVLAMDVQADRLYYYEQSQAVIYQMDVKTGQKVSVTSGITRVGGKNFTLLTSL